MTLFDTPNLRSAANAVSSSLAPATLTPGRVSAAALKSGSVSAVSSAAAPVKTAATTSSSSTDDGTQITSSDFLTLLVTEMQNQDPTQPTDPNAYIQQLVGVNSLQQLISINQDLSGLTSTTASVAATPTVEGL